MKKLVVVADDFGLCDSVNDGVIEAYQEGIVTELSLMLGSPGTDDAVTKAKELDIDDIGLHILLTFWKDNGKTTRRDDYTELFDRLSTHELADLFYAEIKLFEETVGNKPSHVTSQYGIHGHPKLSQTVLKYCAENDVPMRLPHRPNINYQSDNEVDYSASYIRSLGIKTTNKRVSIDFDPEGGAELVLIQSLKEIGDEQSLEFTMHPGKVTEELRSLSSLVIERQRDVDLAKSEKLKDAIEAARIELVKYSQL